MVSGQKIVAGILSQEIGQETPMEIYAAKNKKTEMRNSFRQEAKF